MLTKIMKSKSRWLLVALLVTLGLIVMNEVFLQVAMRQGWTTYTVANSGLAGDLVGIREYVGALAIDGQDRVWMGIDGGLSVLDPDGSWITYTSADSELEGYVTLLAVDGQGRVWADHNGGLSIIDFDGSWTTYISTNSNLTSYSLNALAFDTQDRMWFSNFGQGLNVLTPDDSLVTDAFVNPELDLGSIYALAIDDQGQVWIGTYGLSVLAPDGSLTIYTSANSGLASDFAKALAIDDQGRVWVGTDSGVSMLDPDGSWLTYTSTNSGLADDYVNALSIDSQGRAWIGTNRGVSVLDPQAGLSASVLSFMVALRGVLIFISALLFILSILVSWLTRSASKQSTSPTLNTSQSPQTAPTSAPTSTSIPPTTRLTFATWGKVGATIFAGLFSIAAITLFVLGRNFDTGLEYMSEESLLTVYQTLFWSSAITFVLMLVVLAVADLTPDKRTRQIVISLIGLFALNIFLFTEQANNLLGVLYAGSCYPNCGSMVVPMVVFWGQLALTAIIDIGLLIVLAITRRWWLAQGVVVGMVVVIAYILGWWIPLGILIALAVIISLFLVRR